jgi:hypothetical protein
MVTSGDVVSLSSTRDALDDVPVVMISYVHVS